MRRVGRVASLPTDTLPIASDDRVPQPWDVIALHDAILQRLGVPYAALRDEAALESAITRPRMAGHYEDADLIRQGALLAVGISQAQAFVDGNKRTTYAATETFLFINDTTLTGDPIELAKELEAVATRRDDLDVTTMRFESWLREHSKARGATN